MKLAVPANYDMAFIDTLTGYPVTEVYGKLSYDPVGGGRSSLSTEGVSKSSLKTYITHLRESGIDFNYLLNTACLSNHPWDRRWQKKLNRLLETLAEYGVKRITVSVPLLFKIIRKRFPCFSMKMKLHVSKGLRLCDIMLCSCPNASANSFTLIGFFINFSNVAIRVGFDRLLKNL